MFQIFFLGRIIPENVVVQCELAFYLISRFRNCTALVILSKSKDTLYCSFYISQGTSNNRSRTIPYIHLRRRKGKCMRTFCMRFLPPAAACSGAVAWELNIIANRRLGKTEPGKINRSSELILFYYLILRVHTYPIYSLFS